MSSYGEIPSIIYGGRSCGYHTARLELPLWAGAVVCILGGGLDCAQLYRFWFGLNSFLLLLALRPEAFIALGFRWRVPPPLMLVQYKFKSVCLFSEIAWNCGGV